ncbi:hypothetical protein GCM10010172_35140 [Paractinoplanes ferrugineus]|uniref:Uncharacterized protein n=1 Tax=Paractinoplanes ferrugineus TaxID=113564 RepID=A0A919JGH4_9ACTN|nr:hypothetical protein [Actinoplanes ferrugineus]GIE16776.1 hypothetical protein Afe05nite_86160 [Actinoplanes ferrugineus]
MSSTTALTARKPHYCYSCQWRAVKGDTPIIAPGHRYFRQVAFPGDEGHEQGTQPAVLNQCIGCACEIDDGAHLQAGACGTWCCGTTPCALPFEKGSPGHEHQCRKCVREAAS